MRVRRLPKLMRVRRRPPKPVVVSGEFEITHVDPVWERMILRYIEEWRELRWVALYGPGALCDGMGV